jgi:Zn-finger nucleic acid-binding protein
MQIMDEPHKQIVTTYPVALKSGQKRIHVADEHPWHRFGNDVKCPQCETVFIVSGDFPKVMEILEQHHAKKQSHPDYIASAPDWTDTADCDCQTKKPA